MKDKLLNKLIDEIEYIENAAYWQGIWVDNPKRANCYDKRLALHKTKAFKIIDKLRNVRPDIALSSDFIVGFPGETKKDFYDTIDLVEKIEGQMLLGWWLK